MELWIIVTYVSCPIQFLLASIFSFPDDNSTFITLCRRWFGHVMTLLTVQDRYSSFAKLIISNNIRCTNVWNFADYFPREVIDYVYALLPEHIIKKMS